VELVASFGRIGNPKIAKDFPCFPGLALVKVQLRFEFTDCVVPNRVSSERRSFLTGWSYCLASAKLARTCARADFAGYWSLNEGSWHPFEDVPVIHNELTHR
jgi:hypothetical protein